MLAEIKLPNGETATLGDDVVWQSGDDALASELNDIKRDGYLPHGVYVEKVAAAFGAEITYLEGPKPSQPGTVF